ncbi:hypothetical protein FEM48_Zijuj07G0008600 [Ziziphus jujuba var. spinosa]|uniref:D-arabinono-1,4-lactone oxidase C-terminal domain-containing protein n=1 Tax=Ziziphus jujuba var. spinosa TaxID=714518 RepID=A0A978V1H2_ZIZJJ|nr:hypothetical protein FEM48_Zijuj07G0008600 [Ziziphus jujuba var. spinosa]
MVKPNQEGVYGKASLALATSFISSFSGTPNFKVIVFASSSIFNTRLRFLVLMSSPSWPLGQTSLGMLNVEEAVDFDLTYYRRKNPLIPRLYEDILEEIEQMAVIINGALPHWGKNQNIAFDEVTKKYKNANKFLVVKKLYYPMGLFSSEWTDQISTTAEWDNHIQPRLCIGRPVHMPKGYSLCPKQGLLVYSW